MTTSLSATPRRRIDDACQHLGRSQVVDRCADLLGGGDEADDFVVTLGGAPAVALLAAGVPEDQSYWLRVWAARGLLWAGAEGRLADLRRALSDDHWRVREMICKVVARHGVGDLLNDVSPLQNDPISRVRQAAERAVERIVELDT